jgi:hypothetical protein
VRKLLERIEALWMFVVDTKGYEDHNIHNDEGPWLKTKH